MSTLMIMSLGGSPEPLKKSVEEHKPDKIVFLASHDYVALAGEILRLYPETGFIHSQSLKDLRKIVIKLQESVSFNNNLLGQIPNLWIIITQ